MKSEIYIADRPVDGLPIQSIGLSKTDVLKAHYFYAGWKSNGIMRYSDAVYLCKLGFLKSGGGSPHEDLADITELHEIPDDPSSPYISWVRFTDLYIDFIYSLDSYRAHIEWERWYSDMWGRFLNHKLTEQLIAEIRNFIKENIYLSTREGRLGECDIILTSTIKSHLNITCIPKDLYTSQ